MTSSPVTFLPRAEYFGDIPATYSALNLSPGFSKPEVHSSPGLEPPDFWQAATTQGLDRSVKIVSLPARIPERLSRGSIQAMEVLRDRGELGALRGERETDLPRPHGGTVRRRYSEGIAALVELVERIESVLEETSLFVRAVKLDRARVSSTAVSEDRLATNLHFDAEKSSLAEYSEPIFQFYLNAGRLERQFRILPVPLADMVNRLEKAVPGEDISSRPVEEILELHLSRNPDHLEWIPVPSGSLAIFDGRSFAHDAGKCDSRALIEGRFVPSEEPDLVIALDTIETGHHHGLYHPEIPFFEDRGE